jgi:uncharacterized protein (PEP-CTERM system associated)
MNRTRLSRSRALATLLAASTVLLPAPAGAQTWTPPGQPSGPQQMGTQLGGTLPGGVPARTAQPSSWSASVWLQETVTNNVNLTPSANREYALVTEVTPELNLNHRGPRTSLIGLISLPTVLNVPSGVATNRVYPTVHLVGDVTLVDQFLYVEGDVDISQQFFNPFGAQPSGFTNTTQNRYRSDFYRVSPYIKGVTQAGTNYELRNDNVWTNLNGAPASTNNANYTSFSGKASNLQTTLGWQASFNYTDTRFNTQRPIVNQLYRIAPVYTVDPNLRLSASGGYEENRGSLTSSQGAIYGAGFAWQPTPRTTVAGDYEKRFFGSSYQFSFDHVTPLTVWKLHFSRNITTYPQQLGTLPAGINVAGFLDSLFVFSIPDPAERQRVVNQLMQDRGLPATTTNPVNLYSDQILLQQFAGATVGLLGARNTIFMTIYSVRNEPIAASGTPLPPILAAGNDNTQNGGTIIWSHQLTPSLSFVASADGFQTVANGPSAANTRQGMLRMALSTTVAPMTTVFAGARYQVLRSNLAPEYDEAAVFAGLRYTFR